MLMLLTFLNAFWWVKLIAHKFEKNDMSIIKACIKDVSSVLIKLFKTYAKC